MMPTVPISEIRRLLQAYIDKGTGLSCFLVMQNATFSLMNRRNKTESAVFKRFMLYFQRIPFTD